MQHERKKREWVRKTVIFAVALLLVFGITLFNVFLPFRTLLPARAIDRQGEGELRVYFLDVGQGDCSVVSFPDGRALVIDGGDGSWKNENKLISFFKGLRAASFTYVATHADTDHSGGLPFLVEHFGADALYLPALGTERTLCREAQKAAETWGASVKTAKRYEVLDFGEAYAVFLSPYSEGETDENEASSVLYLKYGETTVLFSADINTTREKKLLAEYEIMDTIFDAGKYTVRLDDVDILKVAHHGSAESSDAGWLGLIRPEVSVISCGRGNAYGHPTGDALQRLADCGSRIYRTDELGDLMISAYPNGEYTVKWDW